MLIKEVGLQIKNLRKEKLKLSQSEFAKKLDWDRIFLSRIERGKQNITP